MPTGECHAEKNVARPVFPSPANGKRRADELVFRQGLAESREQAQRLIMAGKVFLAPTEEETAGGHPLSRWTSRGGSSGPIRLFC